MTPLSLFGVKRIKIGVALSQLSNLLLSKTERFFNLCTQGIGHISQ
jgi:hypothetical protein